MVPLSHQFVVNELIHKLFAEPSSLLATHGEGAEKERGKGKLTVHH